MFWVFGVNTRLDMVTQKVKVGGIELVNPKISEASLRRAKPIDQAAYWGYEEAKQDSDLYCAARVAAHRAVESAIKSGDITWKDYV